MPRGCISASVAELLKADAESNRAERTLIIQRSMYENQIEIGIVETGEKVALSVGERDDDRIYEDNFSR